MKDCFKCGRVATFTWTLSKQDGKVKVIRKSPYFKYVALADVKALRGMKVSPLRKTLHFCEGCEKSAWEYFEMHSEVSVVLEEYMRYESS